MRRYAIGIMAGIGALLGGALAAEAQGINITGTGPTAVYHTDSQSTYTATVVQTGTFKFQLKIFLAGTQKYGGMVRTFSSPGTLNISELVTGMNNWGMQVGQVLDYRGKAWVTTSNQDTDDWYVTILQGTSKLVPPKDRGPLPDPNREELYAIVERREERESA